MDKCADRPKELFYQYSWRSRKHFKVALNDPSNYNVRLNVQDSFDHSQGEPREEVVKRRKMLLCKWGSMQMRVGVTKDETEQYDEIFRDFCESAKGYADYIKGLGLSEAEMALVQEDKHPVYFKM